MLFSIIKQNSLPFACENSSSYFLFTLFLYIFLPRASHINHAKVCIYIFVCILCTTSIYTLFAPTLPTTTSKISACLKPKNVFHFNIMFRLRSSTSTNTQIAVFEFSYSQHTPTQTTINICWPIYRFSFSSMFLSNPFVRCNKTIRKSPPPSVHFLHPPPSPLKMLHTSSSPSIRCYF